MTTRTAIDMARLPPPDVIEPIDPEVILAELKDLVVASAPELAAVIALESEPVVKILQIWAYQVTLHRARVNDGARAVMLAYATGADLDHLAALYSVARLTIQEADPDAVPPIPAILEDDAALRSRTQLALEGLSVAGPVGAYRFHTFSADGRIKDVSVTSPNPGEVLVTFYAEEPDGSPSTAPSAAIEAALNAEDVRPLTDQVTVAVAQTVDVSIDAVITIDDGPDPAIVEEAARDALDVALDEVKQIGADLPVSRIYAALQVPGVRSVTLTDPAGDVAIGPGQIAHVPTMALAFQVAS